MEIEAKFSFRDAPAFAAWLERATLGPFRLERPRTLHVVDTYLDGPGHECLAGGYACRVRRHDGVAIATLKSLANAVGGDEPGVRRREELEVELSLPAADAGLAAGGPAPAWLQPPAWPAGAARDLALRLLDGRELGHLVTITQERHERDVLADGRLVATLSLDRVSFDHAAPPLYELEAELSADATEEDLAVIVAVLRQDPGFTPTARSKLQHALAELPARAATLDALLARRPGDERDATLRTLALRLFDSTAAAYGLAASARPVLDAALRLRAAGRVARPASPESGASDLTIAVSFVGTAIPDRALLAAVAALPALPGEAEHRGHGKHGAGASGDAEHVVAALAGLPEEAQREALALAALIGAAGALLPAIGGLPAAVIVTVSEREATITTTGGAAGADGAIVERAATLWEKAFGAELRLARLPHGDRALPLGLRFDQPLAAAGRVIMGAYLARLQTLEPALRGADSADAVHDARVAARRLRTALRLFRRAYPRRRLRALDGGLQRFGATLGAVRDYDVLLDAVRAAATLSDQRGIDALLDDWERERQRTWQALVAHLDSRRHRVWLKRWPAFLDATAATATGAERLCDAAPALVWGRYAAVRSRGPGLRTAPLPELHELRKEVRRLRYLLECLRELLGSRVADIIRDAIAVQDALGALQDADVLRGLLQERADLFAGVDNAGVDLLRDRTLADLGARRRAVEEVWPTIAGRGFRRALGRGLAEL